MAEQTTADDKPTVFEMPEEWLYIDGADLHEQLMNEKQVEISFKMNEQAQIALREHSPRRVEFHFVCREKMIHSTTFVFDPIEKNIRREA